MRFLTDRPRRDTCPFVEVYAVAAGMAEHPVKNDTDPISLALLHSSRIS